jgi:hypothetical protein
MKATAADNLYEELEVRSRRLETAFTPSPNLGTFLLIRLL